MKKFDLPLVSDIAFYSLTAGILSLAVLRYFRLPLPLSLLLAAIFAAAAGLTVFACGYTSRRKRALTRKARAEADALLLHLALERKGKVAEALAAAFSADGKEVRTVEDALFADGQLLIPLFTMEPLSADVAARLIGEYRETPFTLCCNALSPEAERLLRSFGRTVLKGEEIYALFSRTETMPSPLICGEVPRLGAKGKLRRAFSKKNARPFATGGILLLIMSLFTFFPVYYLVTGSLLLVCAVCVRILGYA